VALSADEVANHVFALAVRGYAVSEVDDLLARVVEHLDQLEQEIVDLKAQLVASEERLAAVVAVTHQPLIDELEQATEVVLHVDAPSTGSTLAAVMATESGEPGEPGEPAASGDGAATTELRSTGSGDGATTDGGELELVSEHAADATTGADDDVSW
jgi:DivIVA domain-containing protein